jgi:hypothetical protein
MGHDGLSLVLIRPLSDPDIGSKTANLLDTKDQYRKNPKPPAIWVSSCSINSRE